MDEVYLLAYVYEDEFRIYGIYSDYLKAESELHNLNKYNEMVYYGTLHIYKYNINKTYINDAKELVI